MNDDFNTPRFLAVLHEGLRHYHRLKIGQAHLTEKDRQRFADAYRTFVVDLLGLVPEHQEHRAQDTIRTLMEIILDVRQHARKNKDFEMADRIRNALLEAGFTIKDTPKGTEWTWHG